MPFLEFVQSQFSGAVDSVRDFFDRDDDGKISTKDLSDLLPTPSFVKRETEALQFLKDKKDKGQEITSGDLRQSMAIPSLSEAPMGPLAKIATKGAEELVVKPAARAVTSLVLSGEVAQRKGIEVPSTPLTASIFGSGLSGEEPGAVTGIQQQFTSIKEGEGELGALSNFLSEKTGAAPGTFAFPLLAAVTLVDLFPENPLVVAKALREAKLSKTILSKTGPDGVKILKALEKGEVAKEVDPLKLESVLRIIHQETGHIPDVGGLTTDIKTGKIEIIKNKGEKVLEQFDEIVQFGKRSEEPSAIARLREAVTGTREAFINQYTRFDDLQSSVLKQVGKSRSGLLLSEQAEQLAGISGKQQLLSLNFDEKVVEPIKDVYEEFGKYLALRRTFARTKTGQLKTMVGDFTPQDSIKGLQALEQRVGVEAFNRIEQSANEFQKMTRVSLRTLREGGVISRADEKALTQSTDFYATFRVLRNIGDEVERSVKEGRGIQISSRELLKGLKGIKPGEEFKLFDPTASTLEHMTRSLALAERNKFMQNFAGLAKISKEAGGDFSSLIRKASKADKANATDGIIEIYEDGKKVRYIVNKEIAAAVKNMNGTQLDTVKRVLSMAQKPFKFGAITANAAFQIGNLFFSDIPRNVLLNKYQKISPELLVSVPLDYLRGFYASLSLSTPGLTANKLAREVLDKKILSSTIARTLDPESFARGKVKGFFKNIQAVPSRIGDTIESTSKIAGYLPGKRAVTRGVATMDEVIREVRNYAGSPDFARRGSKTKDMNLLFMFFNARLQGVAADLRRLQPLDLSSSKRLLKPESLQAWAKIAALVLTPTAMLTAHNLREENREDFEKIPQFEKDNYFMIPKSLLYGIEDSKAYFKNENGETIRDYWKIQKREVVKLLSNIVEDGVKYSVDRDPSLAIDMFKELIEGVSPINIEGEDASERGMSIVSSLNPLIKIPLEGAFGKNTFTKRDIIPEYVNGVATDDLLLRHPELVYKDSTPEEFVALGHALKMSPLILEHWANGITGGLSRSVFRKKEVESGRESLGRVASRFHRSPYIAATESDEKLLDTAAQAASDYAAGKLDKNKMAQKIIEAIPVATDEELAAMTASVDEAVMKAVRSQLEKEALGLDYTDQQIKNLPSNEAKARFLLINFESLPKEEMEGFLIRMKEIGVLTSGVKQALKELYISGEGKD